MVMMVGLVMRGGKNNIRSNKKETYNITDNNSKEYHSKRDKPSHYRDKPI